MNDSVESSELPQPIIRGRRRMDTSLIWLVPVLAALVGLTLIVRSCSEAGPEITISFNTAEGLEKGKTEVKFKNVVIGKVREITLNDDLQGVRARIALTGDAENLAVADTRFWVVRPRADLSGISGLNTLLSGTYIGVDAGTSPERRTEFVGLDVPPPITHDQRGKRFMLTSSNLGSLGIGSPVYFRRIPVGRVTAYELVRGGKSVKLQIFVDDPYAQFVTTGTRFWNASGVDVKLDASGLKFNTESLVTLLTGGVAFGHLPNEGEPAAAESTFRLFPEQQTALARPDGITLEVSMRFQQSIRGLSVDAPVDFKGIELGRVKTIGMDFDTRRKRFDTLVTAEIYPERLGPSYHQFRKQEGGDSQQPEILLSRLIERGLRAQLRSGNLLTGQLYVALEFIPKAPKLKVDLAQLPLDLPTLPGSLDQIQSQIAGIVDKLDQVPIVEIGNHLRNTLKTADSLMLQLDTELAPEAIRTLESVNDNLAGSDGAVIKDVQRTLGEVDRAARSLRNLGDYLQRHPEALIQGKPDAAQPDIALEPAK